LQSIARTYAQLHQHDKALPLLIRSLAIFENTPGSASRDIINVLGSLTWNYGVLGQYAQALVYMPRLIGAIEKVNGKNHTDFAAAIGNQSWLYFQLAQYELALPLAVRTLEISEELYGMAHPETAVALNNLAAIYNDLARFYEALKIQLRTLDMLEDTVGPEHPDTAFALNNLAETYKALAQYDRSIVLLSRSLAVLEKAKGQDHPDVAQVLNNLVNIYTILSQHGKALPLALRALSIQEKLLGEYHPNTALILGNLANIYDDLAQHDIALPLHRRSLAIREHVLGPTHPTTALALDNLAASYTFLAQFDEALPLYLRALEIREKSNGPNHPDTALALSNLSVAYGFLGQYEVALQLENRALGIVEAAMGPDHPDTASILTNIGESYLGLGRYGPAADLFQRALDIREKAFGPGHPATARALINLAEAFDSLGQTEEALVFKERALSIMEASQGDKHPNFARALSAVAVSYTLLEKYERAQELFLRSLAIREKALVLNHPDTAINLGNVAYTFAKGGDLELAIVFNKAAVNSFQSVREGVSRMGANELRSYTARVSLIYRRLADLLTDRGRLAEAQMVLDMLKEDEQFDFVRRKDESDPRRSRIGFNSTEQVWISRYRLIADRLGEIGREYQALQGREKTGLSSFEKQRQQSLLGDLKVAQFAFDEFIGEMRVDFARKGVARLVEMSETTRRAERERRELLKGLGDGVALLRIYMTDNQVNLLLTTPSVEIARRAQVSFVVLNRQIATFRRALRDTTADPRAQAFSLYQVLIAPIAQDIEKLGLKTVMLSLDGSLRYIPFGALHDGQSFLIQRWNLPLYTSVTRDRLRDPVAPLWEVAGLGVTRKLGQFEALPGVKTELAGIIRAGIGQSGVAGALPGEIYIDEAFTAQRLKSVSERPFTVLHLASHFQFSPGTERNSFLLLGDGQQLTLGDIRTQNYRFDFVDLLTLSACDTGLGGGRDEQGREIEGFGVVAQQQGAKAVLATLWPVGDQSTAILMADMYRRRQENNLNKIEALRQAQLSLLKHSQYSHPYYWAPFILMGNWK
jgi:CHAT domain-containing protein/tetratricopeptide (TPR) repeat protein